MVQPQPWLFWWGPVGSSLAVVPTGLCPFTGTHPPPDLPALPSTLQRSPLSYFSLSTSFSAQALLSDPALQTPLLTGHTYHLVTKGSFILKLHSLALGGLWSPLGGWHRAENYAYKSIK